MKMFVESMCAGSFPKKNPEQAFECFDYLANLSSDWACTELTALSRQVEALAHAKAATSLTNESSSMCVLCDTIDHCTDVCPIVAGVKEARGQVNVIAAPQPMPYVALQALPPAPQHAQYQRPHRRNEDNELRTKVTSRPFLAIANVVIHCRHGLLKLSFGNMTLETNIFTVGKQMREVDQIEEINVIESIIQEHVDREFMEDSIERDLVWSESHDQLEFESVSFRDASIVSKESDSVMHVGHWTPTFEPLAPSVVKPIPSEEKPPILERKPLPSTLKYAFLGEGESYPVVISSSLTEGQEESLLKVLKRHRKSLGWTIADLHGISPLMCTHHIYLEEESKPVCQMQRRLNPNMKEVVRGEVLKFLDAGIIYPISNSKWVNPTPVVPKKSGVTVVKNEHNDLVLTRIQTGWEMCIDYRKLNAATRKDHFPLPFLDQVLERVAGQAFYYFLDDYFGYNQIEVALKDQDKTTFTCPLGTYAYRRMPFGLCNSPATFQRCMISIFSDMVEKILEVFMDDFSVYGDMFESCLEYLECVLERCEESHLVLN
ncbi:hypothetical protein Acr_23g0004340 [Actinidia rufa]|uniref:Reverse transcriptase domain-containing protein n=1 Tax=Actinidia rufa TaxID=165716 RepID=A0A7J0GML2_9ERIC|nr:hypothetical protein Acr_23g0004340 [Actinidia rufa]